MIRTTTATMKGILLGGLAACLCGVLVLHPFEQGTAVVQNRVGSGKLVQQAQEGLVGLLIGGFKRLRGRSVGLMIVRAEYQADRTHRLG